MSSKSYIMIAVTVIIILAAVYYLFLRKKSSENFRYFETQAQPVPMRPSLLPTPGTQPPRFDTERVSTNTLLGQAPPMSLMAAPSSPSPSALPVIDYSTIGSSSNITSPTALTTQQANDMLKQKMGTTTPQYMETSELMPTVDMRYSAGIDPTDPQNFMYDRTIFGKLKRRYGNGVDFIRGDLDIQHENRGWFDIQPPTETDVVNGYFDNYLDVQQSLSLRDTAFSRVTPVQTLLRNQVNQWGDTNKFAYNHV